MTVSRVLNDSPWVSEETRARVLAAIEVTGYQRNGAARALATTRSGRIGVLSRPFDGSGLPGVAEAIQVAAETAGYEVVIVAAVNVGPTRMRVALQQLIDQGVEAVILTHPCIPATPGRRPSQATVPIVTLGGHDSTRDASVTVDQELGGRLATEHLISLGHRLIAHVAGPRGRFDTESRRSGWLAANADAGLLPGPELAGDMSAKSGYSAGLRIAVEPTITAVFAGNDAMALGIIHALTERGREVPGDVSVVGFDDQPESAYFLPPLTTINQDLATLGREAVATAVRLINGETALAAQALRPSLSVRRSSAAPRSQPM